MISHQFMVRGHKWQCFSPDGESLSFASPKERNQRKGDPSSSPFGFPSRDARTGAPPTRPNRLHKTQSVAELKHGYAFFPPAHFDSATRQGEPRARSTDNQKSCYSTKESMLHPLGPLLCRREAQPHGEKRRRVSELRSGSRFVRPARASCGAAPCGEHRREAEGRHSRGRLSLVTSENMPWHVLHQGSGEAKKVTRQQAKYEAVRHD